MQLQSNSPSIKDSLSAKGLAVLLMLLHHLFAFPERLKDVSYISIIPMFHSAQTTPEFYLGQLGKLCVPLFLFLSGFGMMERMSDERSSRVRYALKKGIHFLGSYWIAFILFVPIGLLFFKSQARYSFSLAGFFSNFFVLSFTYNPEWWFVRTYFVLLALFPVLSLLANRHPRALAGAALLGLLLSLKFTFIQNIGLHQASFTLGILFSRLKLFEKLSAFFFSKNGNFAWADWGIPLFALRALLPGETLLDPFLAVLALTYLMRLNRRCPWISAPLSGLGRQALPIWLTHSFFCYYYFQPLVFAPKLSVLITLWLLFLAWITALVISNIQEIISRKLSFTLQHSGRPS